MPRLDYRLHIVDTNMLAAAHAIGFSADDARHGMRR